MDFSLCHKTILTDESQSQISIQVEHNVSPQSIHNKSIQRKSTNHIHLDAADNFPMINGDDKFKSQRSFQIRYADEPFPACACGDSRLAVRTNYGFFTKSCQCRQEW